MAVAVSSTCPGLYCGRTMINGSVDGDCGVCPRGERTNLQKVCERCTETPDLYDWLYLGFMAMLPLVLHWFFIEWYSGKKSSSALLQHVTAMLECSLSSVATLLLTDPVGLLSIRSCRVQMLSDWYTMLYNPSPDYINTLHCTQEAVYPLYTMVLIYYAFCLVLMMLLRPLLVKKIACGLGKSDRFKSVYAALYFFPILTVLQAVGGGLLFLNSWRTECLQDGELKDGWRDHLPQDFIIRLQLQTDVKTSDRCSAADQINMKTLRSTNMCLHVNMQSEPQIKLQTTRSPSSSWFCLW
ncbi:JNK1/MAPK8-associated membrane protein isoform X2 [Brachyistius frenatus]|uniref:JNK1/MAPK8-associated membrane protein isoform X2 n=1 Tax=Brachyistius frenatus TaxID=100188 RepID=UPI0037E7248A